MLEIFRQEIDVLLAIDFPLIVCTFDNFWLNNGKGWLCYTMELCELGDLWDLITDHK